MRKIVICLTLLITSCISKAQKPFAHYDHIDFYVQNLDTSVAFYTKFFRLDSISNPFKNVRTKWFKFGGNVEFHLNEGLKEPVNLPLMSHLCLSVPSLDDFVAELIKSSIPYYNARMKQGEIDKRIDGIKRVFFKDPDGYWLEVNNAVH